MCDETKPTLHSLDATVEKDESSSSAETVDRLRAQLLKEVSEVALALAKEERSELLDAFRTLDAKAQATTAIAGVFIAATAAFVQSSDLRSIEAWLVALIGMSLTWACIAIVGALKALKVRRVAMSLTADYVESVRSDLERAIPASRSISEQSRADYAARFLNTLRLSTASDLDTLREVAQVKADWVSYAQLILVWSAVSAALAVTLRLFVVI